MNSLQSITDNLPVVIEYRSGFKRFRRDYPNQTDLSCWNHWVANMTTEQRRDYCYQAFIETHNNWSDFIIVDVGGDYINS